jgi:23S rRNA pseudouridine2605 synthase
MCEAVGHPVDTLTRVRIGPIGDRRLRPGDWRELKAEEIAALKHLADAPPRESPRRRGFVRSRDE